MHRALHRQRDNWSQQPMQLGVLGRAAAVPVLLHVLLVVYKAMQQSKSGSNAIHWKTQECNTLK